MNSDNSEEIFPVVDAAGNVVGKATRGECHGGSMLLHPVVHLHLFNSRGELYLQKRPAWKDIQPGRWDTAVGGHVAYGETIDEALRREAREELGLESFEAEFVRSYVFRSEREQELVYVHRCRYDGVRWACRTERRVGRRSLLDTARDRRRSGRRDLYPQFRRRDPPCGGAAGCRALSPRFRSLRLFGTQGGLPSGDR